PEDEREVFDLVGIQGLTHPEAAAVVGVSEKTVQRTEPGPAPAGGAVGRPPPRHTERPRRNAGRRPRRLELEEDSRWPTTPGCSDCLKRCSARGRRPKRCAATAPSCSP